MGCFSLVILKTTELFLSWHSGDFTVKIVGNILLSNGIVRPISVFISGCCEPQDVAGKLVIGLDPSPDAFYPYEIVRRCPTELDP